MLISKAGIERFDGGAELAERMNRERETKSFQFLRLQEGRNVSPLLMTCCHYQ
jgi:hypothetical protein